MRKMNKKCWSEIGIEVKVGEEDLQMKVRNAYNNEEKAANPMTSQMTQMMPANDAQMMPIIYQMYQSQQTNRFQTFPNVPHYPTTYPQTPTNTIAEQQNMPRLVRSNSLFSECNGQPSSEIIG